jgi:hypothetical protein
MDNPSSAVESLLGVKSATLVAGFIGAVVSLSYNRPLNRVQMLVAVLVGTATAVYGAPLALHYLGLSENMERPVSFFIGVVAMRAIPAIMDRIVAIFPSLNPPEK